MKAKQGAYRLRRNSLIMTCRRTYRNSGDLPLLEGHPT